MTGGESSGTVEVKCGDLIGPALDWAVAISERETPLIRSRYVEDAQGNIAGVECFVMGPSPSSDWSRGGPLVAELLKTGQWEIVQGVVPGEVMVQNYNMECLPVDGESYDHPSVCFASDSLLIAACRAIVSANLGEVVSVPAELVKP